MSDTGLSVDELERLVDRHIELSELFGGGRAHGRREAPVLATMAEGKDVAECIADLADRALVAYERTGFLQDGAIFSLKAALAQVISGKLD